ncbi:SIR2 family protein [candidate division WOR-3 bacterium]|nr:SIR2 family protein [candidate division WOR-3 bacterium]
MTNEDKMIQLAFSIYSNPGIYALLIGSGASRGSGIPTGWEIMLDLIRKIGAVSGEKEIENPEKWYWDKYKEKPTYSNLVKRLARTREEQRGILREYFEPNKKEGEAGEKQPTKAHKTIARLVSKGYIKMILTTNFDRLIEKAIEEEGISDYQVISTKDKMKGRTPYIHRVTIIKLHGDYIDGEMKNTPEELLKYSKEKNKLLDKVFDDFGLIVCGWSAMYDEALRNALHRRKNRRYSIYWTVRSEPESEAKKLVKFLKANLITIEGADTFYEELSNKIEALEAYSKPHPLSSAIAIEETKKCIAENNYIKLDDLVRKERKKIKNKFENSFYGNPGEFGPEELVNYCFNNLETLLHIIACISFYSNGNYKKILISTIEEFAYENMNGYEYLPILAIIYTCGITSLLNENYVNLFGLLIETKLRGRNVKSLIEEVYVNEMTNWIQSSFEKYKNRPTSSSFLLCNNLKRLFVNFTTNEKEYEDFFDVFEFLYALVYLWLTIEDIESTNRFWTPVGKYAWNFSITFSNSYIKYFIEERIKEGDNWSFLKTGFFDGSIDKFETYYKKYKENVPDIWG